MALMTPTNVTAVVSAISSDQTTCDILITWDIARGAHPGPYTVELQYRADSGTWAVVDSWDTTDYPTTSHLHEDLAVNHLYGYRVSWYCDDCGEDSPWSAEGDVGAYVLTATDTITLTDSLSTGLEEYENIYCSDTITLTDSLTVGTTYSVSATETITLTDYLIAGSTLKTNFGFYFGTAAGDAYHYDSSYTSDNGTAILVRWRSKETDFADQYPQYIDHMKWIDRVRLIYVDKSADTPYTVKVSTDGGTNWTSQSATLGTGDGTIKDASFWFNVSGRYFQFEVETSSASKTVQWISLEPQFLATAEYWEV